MLSKARIKFIKSLQIKKYRKQEQSFLVQGAKSVRELLTSGFQVEFVIGTAEFLNSLAIQNTAAELLETSAKELESLGEYQSNDAGLAVAKMKPNLPPHRLPGSVTLVLDDVRDPGNLGTIIRSADWYGFNSIYASPETADFYNPKVIAATMGSFTRTTVFYTPLAPVLSSVEEPVYGAFLDGEDVHHQSFAGGGFIVIGNESKGISPEIEQFITRRITIPRYGRAESLNAAVATAIICDNVRRTFTLSPG